MLGTVRTEKLSNFNHFVDSNTEAIRRVAVASMGNELAPISGQGLVFCVILFIPT